MPCRTPSALITLSDNPLYFLCLLRHSMNCLHEPGARSRDAYENLSPCCPNQDSIVMLFTSTTSDKSSRSPRHVCHRSSISIDEYRVNCTLTSNLSPPPQRGERLDTGRLVQGRSEASTCMRPEPVPPSGHQAGRLPEVHQQ